MKLRKTFVIYFFLQFISLAGFAGNNDFQENSILNLAGTGQDTTTLMPINIQPNSKYMNMANDIADTLAVSSLEKTKFKPNPLKSIWMGAAIPGFGQIVNRKYWKLPIVYGGYLGFAYAISWNNNNYITYKNAYRDIIDKDPTTNSHIDILPRGYTIQMIGESTYTNMLKTRQSTFRQWRDLSIILSVGYYALVLLDAYVDAQLYDFDISPDLVLNVQPTRIERERNSPAAYGLHCSINF
ncbi:MAG TPA: DUF5683 domain-containing protein [Paludibacteraceae bacterium]|nr:DUF5683 domain-containing protein [Paludibacteraceae bacterium]HPT42323.1 DUF5683 domain-containing protein [Paludibacteraceae bacterium]